MNCLLKLYYFYKRLTKKPNLTTTPPPFNRHNHRKYNRKRTESF